MRWSKQSHQRQRPAKSETERSSSHHSTRSCESEPAKPTAMHSRAMRWSKSANNQGKIAMKNSRITRMGLGFGAGLGALALTIAPAFAAATPDPLNSGDTAWMITSSALVLLMTVPGLALFYAGMVRKKNILATAAQSFGATCIITVLWMVIGYSLSFTTNADSQANQFIGSFNYFMLGPMGLKSVSGLAGTIP